MKQIILVFAAFFLIGFSFGQITGYEDVGVIVNDNSPVSLQIGNYFKQVRNIPEQNMIHIQTLTDEVIDTIELKNIIHQVRLDIYKKGLENTLNYLVTTKGVPFDIAVDSCSVAPPNSTWHMCSSLESELTLLLSADSAKIGQDHFINNPYYGSEKHISDSETDILLVSRLDGKSVEEVYKLIDRSGPETFINKQLAKFIFDISYLTDTDIMFDYWSQRMEPAMDTLNQRGWNSMFHGDTLLPAAQENVAGYVSFCQEMITSPLEFSWVNGSFAELIIPSLNFTFYDSSNYLNELQLSGMIQQGCGSGGAYLHATFGSKITDYTIFFSRYTAERDTAYSLAESYFMATQTLSWTNILVGDPKTTITTIGTGAVGETAPDISAQLYPNPATGKLKIGMNAVRNSAITIRMYDLLGNLYVKEFRQIAAGRNDLELNILSLDEGLYFVQIIENGSGISFTKKLMVK